MKRFVGATMVAAGVLLTGTIAYAVMASTTPPSVDHINVVVTDRPVFAGAALAARDSTAAPSPSEVVTVTPAAVVAAAAVPVAPAHRTRTVAQRVVVSKSTPKVIEVPAVAATPAEKDNDTDREVVTPTVRDDDADGKTEDTEDHPKAESPTRITPGDTATPKGD